LSENADLFGQWGIIIAFFIGLTGLGTFVWNMVKGYKKRQDEREALLMKAEEAKAAVIKKDIEMRADQIKRDADDTARDVKEAVEQRANVIKMEIEATSRTLREHNQLMISQVSKQITDVDEKLMTMLNELSERADMTNGNVKLIREEIQQVNEDIEDIWNLLEDTDETAVTHDRSRDISNANRRATQQQMLRRRRKRESISDRSKEQEHQKKEQPRSGRQ
jgi:hypothetical protein